MLSLVGGTVSMHLTGKGLSDHALSFAVDQDCSLFRVFYRVSICRPKVSLQSVNGTLIAAAPAQGEEFIVLGSYDQYREAEMMARANQDLHAWVAAWHAATSLYEVRLGPFSAEQSAATQLALRTAGRVDFTVLTADDYGAIAELAPPRRPGPLDPG